MPAWVPLESNPDVLNHFVANLGVDTKTWQFFDVFGLDDELLAMMPSAIAVIMLFPVTGKYEAYKAEEQVRLESTDPEHAHLRPPASTYYTRQTIRNACGTIAVLHSLFNTRDSTVIPGTHAHALYELTKNLSPEDRAKAMETFAPLASAHTAVASEGQTVAPDANDDVDLHFVAFVNVEGTLVELDGSKKKPVAHGPVEGGNLLKSVARVTREFMARDPENVHFTLIGLGAAE
ncbi:hypothetical protein BC828DRAFT_382230 [Blastocladiella britannica]|nr:hypothetical protein BC828DRAFT_382230 [Blastocladiella britannica]